MADKTQLGAPVGTGDVIATDDLGALGKAQWVKLMDGTDNGTATIPGDSTNGLRVDVNNVAVADGGALPAKGVQVGGTDGSVFQVLSTDAAGRLNTNINGTVPVSGGLTDTQLRASAVPVDTELPAAAALADGASNPTAPATGAFGLLWNGATWDRAPGSATGGLTTNLKQLNGTTVDTNSGVKSAGTLRTVLATDQPALTNALKVDGSAVTQPVSNAGTFAVQDSQKVVDNAAFTDGTTPVNPVGFIFDEVAGTALTENDAGAARIDSKRAQVLVVEDATTRGQRAAVSAAGAVKVDGSAVTQPVSGTVSITANSSVNVAQVAGTTTDTNSGVKSAGTQRVVIATDQPALTNALKVDPSAVTSPVSLASLPALATGSNLIGRVNLEPETTGGLSIFHLVSAATTNATNLKASAGQVYGWYIYNSNAAARKVVFHNTAGTPTAGAAVIFAIVIPPTSAANVEYTTGIAFATGIAITTVTDLTDAGATAVGLNDLIINVFFK